LIITIIGAPIFGRQIYEIEYSIILGC